MKKHYIIVTADTNDGDYVSEKNKITPEKIDLIRPLCQAIKKDPSFGTGEMLEKGNRRNSSNDFRKSNDPQRFVEQGFATKEALDAFMGYIPYGEYGIHTIESVEILIVEDEYSLV